VKDSSFFSFKIHLLTIYLFKKIFVININSFLLSLLSINFRISFQTHGSFAKTFSKQTSADVRPVCIFCNFNICIVLARSSFFQRNGRHRYVILCMFFSCSVQPGTPTFKELLQSLFVSKEIAFSFVSDGAPSKPRTAAGSHSFYFRRRFLSPTCQSLMCKLKSHPIIFLFQVGRNLIYYWTVDMLVHRILPCLFGWPNRCCLAPFLHSAVTHLMHTAKI
jgi:hypothetical protein